LTARRRIISLHAASPFDCTPPVHLSHLAASPPDVRQGYALPVAFPFHGGLGPRFGLRPNFLGQRPNRGHSPKNLFETCRQGRALPHIGRRSRGEQRQVILSVNAASPPV
jgi:hypothetical protein